MLNFCHNYVKGGIVLTEKDGVVFRQSRTRGVVLSLIFSSVILMSLPLDTTSRIVFAGTICLGVTLAIFLLWGQTTMIVSEKGITVFKHLAIHPETRNQFISWKNFKRVEIRKRGIANMGIFAISDRKLNSASEAAALNKVISRGLGWEETPTIRFPLVLADFSSEDALNSINKHHSLYHGNPFLGLEKEVVECEDSTYKEEKFIID